MVKHQKNMRYLLFLSMLIALSAWAQEPLSLQRAYNLAEEAILKEVR